MAKLIDQKLMVHLAPKCLTNPFFVISGKLRFLVFSQSFNFYSKFHLSTQNVNSTNLFQNPENCGFYIFRKIDKESQNLKISGVAITKRF